MSRGSSVFRHPILRDGWRFQMFAIPAFALGPLRRAPSAGGGWPASALFWEIAVPVLIIGLFGAVASRSPGRALPFELTLPLDGRTLWRRHALAVALWFSPLALAALVLGFAFDGPIAAVRQAGLVAAGAALAAAVAGTSAVGQSDPFRDGSGISLGIVALALFTILVFAESVALDAAAIGVALAVLAAAARRVPPALELSAPRGNELLGDSDVAAWNSRGTAAAGWQWPGLGLAVGTCAAACLIPSWGGAPGVALVTILALALVFDGAGRRASAVAWLPVPVSTSVRRTAWPILAGVLLAVPFLYFTREDEGVQSLAAEGESLAAAVALGAAAVALYGLLCPRRLARRRGGTITSCWPVWLVPALWLVPFSRLTGPDAPVWGLQLAARRAFDVIAGALPWWTAPLALLAAFAIMTRRLARGDRVA